MTNDQFATELISILDNSLMVSGRNITVSEIGENRIAALCAHLKLDECMNQAQVGEPIQFGNAITSPSFVGTDSGEAQNKVEQSYEIQELIEQVKRRDEANKALEKRVAEAHHVNTILDKKLKEKTIQHDDLTKAYRSVCEQRDHFDRLIDNVRKTIE